MPPAGIGEAWQVVALICAAIEEPLPSASVADYVCGSLPEVARLLFERVDRERSTR